MKECRGLMVVVVKVVSGAGSGCEERQTDFGVLGRSVSLCESVGANGAGLRDRFWLQRCGSADYWST